MLISRYYNLENSYISQIWISIDYLENSLSFLDKCELEECGLEKRDCFEHDTMIEDFSYKYIEDDGTSYYWGRFLGKDSFSDGEVENFVKILLDFLPFMYWFDNDILLRDTMKVFDKLNKCYGDLVEKYKLTKYDEITDEGILEEFEKIKQEEEKMGDTCTRLDFVGDEECIEKLKTHKIIIENHLKKIIEQVCHSQGPGAVKNRVMTIIKYIYGQLGGIPSNLNQYYGLMKEHVTQSNDVKELLDDIKGGMPMIVLKRNIYESGFFQRFRSYRNLEIATDKSDIENIWIFSMHQKKQEYKCFKEICKCYVMLDKLREDSPESTYDGRFDVTPLEWAENHYKKLNSLGINRDTLIKDVIKIRQFFVRDYRDLPIPQKGKGSKVRTILRDYIFSPKDDSYKTTCFANKDLREKLDAYMLSELFNIEVNGKLPSKIRSELRKK